jgi:3-oxoacyl-ACP reductase-like protein
MIVATPDIPTGGTEDSAAAGPLDPPNPADDSAPLGVLTQAFPAPAPALAPVPAPVPEPAPNVPHLTPDELYNLAVRHLHSLAADDSTSRWEYITREIKQVRSLMRDEQGLPDENLSGLEKEQLRLSQQGYEQSFVGDVGRRRKKVRYTE